MLYRIKIGSHGSSWIPSITFRESISGSFSFLGDFEYVIDSQEDTNKLVGLSDGWTHHKNSIRIGWRWNNGLELMTIVYRNGVREIKSMGYIEANKKYKYQIQIFDDFYGIKVTSGDTTYAELLDRSTKWNFIRVVLKPYFGGKNKAPKSFDILLD